MLRCTYRAFVIGMIVLNVLVLGIVGARATEDWRERECRMNEGSSTWRTVEVENMIRCAVGKWPVPGGVSKALQVARCESGSDMLDRSTDGYAGTYQQATRYWPERRRAHRPAGWRIAPSVYNPRSNVTVSIRMASRGGWDDWPGCA